MVWTVINVLLTVLTTETCDDEYRLFNQQSKAFFSDFVHLTSEKMTVKQNIFCNEYVLERKYFWHFLNNC